LENTDHIFFEIRQKSDEKFIFHNKENVLKANC